MPDMTYSKAYETYAPTAERLANTEADGDPSFNNRPVAGTVARGDMAAYHLPNDSTGYALSAGVKSPLAVDAIDLKEAQRLFLVNCAICHGPKLDGNGPLYKDGTGPYTAAPRNLTDDYSKKLAEGTMFHVVTYGKGQMGSYASQLTTKQRWMVVAYIKSKQGGAGPAAPADSTGAKGAGATTGSATPGAAGSTPAAGPGVQKPDPSTGSGAGTGSGEAKPGAAGSGKTAPPSKKQ